MIVMSPISPDPGGQLSEYELASLISSRICHDLISPVGAIGNGLELLRTMGQSFGPEMSLVADSAERASAKLNFFRIAFGDAIEGAEIRTQLVATSLKDMYQGTRFNIAFDAGNAVSLPRLDGKLVLLLILCLESSMPMGGEISITYRTEGHWLVTAAANRTNWNAEDWAVVVSGTSADKATSYNVHFVAARYAALQNRSVVTAKNDEGKIALTIKAHPR